MYINYVFHVKNCNNPSALKQFDYLDNAAHGSEFSFGLVERICRRRRQLLKVNERKYNGRLYH